MSEKEKKVATKKKPKQPKQPKRQTIDTTGEEVDVTADTSPSPSLTVKDSSEKSGSQDAFEVERDRRLSKLDLHVDSDPLYDTVEANPPAPPPTKEEILQATYAMAQAAAEDPEGKGALALGDKLGRQALIETIAFQLPPRWINPEVVARLKTIETPALAVVLSWLALNWWAGYEVGRDDAISSIKVAFSKREPDEEAKATVSAVEKQIREDRERTAREETEDQS